MYFFAPVKIPVFGKDFKTEIVVEELIKLKMFLTKIILKLKAAIYKTMPKRCFKYFWRVFTRPLILR